jgi:hypothetical protein
MIILEMRYIPMYEKRAEAITNSKKGKMPTLLMRYGKLNIPDPIALANNANIDPRIAPAFIGAKAL